MAITPAVVKAPSLGLGPLAGLLEQHLSPRTYHEFQSVLSCPPNGRITRAKTTPCRVPLNSSVVEPVEGGVAAWSSGGSKSVPKPAASTSAGIVRNADSQALTQAHRIRSYSMGPAIGITSSPGDCHAHWSLGTTGLEHLALWLAWRRQVFSGLLLNTSWH